MFSPLVPPENIYFCSLFFLSFQTLARVGTIGSELRVPVVVRELLFFRAGAGRSRTIGREGKRSDKLETWGKVSLSGLPRGLDEERKGQLRQRKVFFADGAVPSSWKSH